MNRFFVILTSFIFISTLLISQEVLQDGYNKFYHPNGNISSEGYVEDGKPNGYWRNYYEDGTIMSEGNRLFFELDSVWNFYSPDGNLINSITYRNNEKNGYTFSYDFYYTRDSVKVYYLSSKELFYLGIREGLSYYYNKDENLKYTFNYKSDKRSGEGKEYDKNGLVITLFNYYNGYQIDAVRINRRDNNNLKQGKWMEFYPGGTKKTESNYLDDRLHGMYYEYDLAGKVTTEIRYVNGEIYIPQEDDIEDIVLKAEVKKTFYPNGRLQYEGAFFDNIPVGIHREYDEQGKLIINKEYNSEGELLGEGLFDENGNRVGRWRLYDPYYEYFYGEGNYVKGLKEGKWTYYFPDRSVEQEGYYSDGKPDREWIWYFRNGNVKIEESYLLGKLEGPYIEYDSTGYAIIKGEYFDDARIGEWTYNVGYINEKGSYDFGSKVGEWKQFYNLNNKKYFVGSFRNGEADGTHTWYYPDGSVKETGNYRIGKKNKDWKKYNPDGTLYITYTYRNDELIKIDGKKTLAGSPNKK